MKKFIGILCLLMAFATQSFAKEVKEEINTVQTVDAVYSKIEQGVAYLSIALKEPAEKIWIILVKQQFLDSISNTLILLSLFIICLIVMKVTYNMAKKNNDGWFEEAYTGIPASIAAIILIIIIAIIASSGNDIITGFVNPEYGAIKDILSAIQ